ncbi:hypothetical protein [Sulfurovum sp.]|uniref:hypothetical protein n=1 Tax=Sulfurovum sp. TaxID=1969726 RepID=UPI0025CD839E|nr:hypothetical protein [Sulfurovum sp.]
MVRSVRKRELLHVFRFGTETVGTKCSREGKSVRKRELLHVFRFGTETVGTKCSREGKLLIKSDWRNPMTLKILFFIMLSVNMLSAQNIYERNCIPCHKDLPTSLQQMFKEYLLVYSGEQNVKAGIKHYLKYPNRSISVMSALFIDNFGIKKKSTLTPKELDEAVDIYWDKFKVFNKLK